jgi:hypothetical protein
MARHRLEPDDNSGRQPKVILRAASQLHYGVVRSVTGESIGLSLLPVTCDHERRYEINSTYESAHSSEYSRRDAARYGADADRGR